MSDPHIKKKIIRVLELAQRGAQSTAAGNLCATLDADKAAIRSVRQHISELTKATKTKETT